jgi:hypothetical protein
MKKKTAYIDVEKYLKKIKQKGGIVEFNVPPGAVSLKFELLSGERMPVAWITWKYKANVSSMRDNENK